MAARLGDVLYWAGTIIAALAIGLGVYVLNYGDQFVAGVLIIFGILCWLLGRAIRYVLAGR